MTAFVANERITYRGRTVGVLGVVLGTPVLLKDVRRRNRLRVAPVTGWAVDAGALRRARAAGAKAVILTDEDGTRYVAPLSRFDRHGARFDFGWGEQVALSDAHWTRIPLGEPLTSDHLAEEEHHD